MKIYLTPKYWYNKFYYKINVPMYYLYDIHRINDDIKTLGITKSIRIVNNLTFYLEDEQDFIKLKNYFVPFKYVLGWKPKDENHLNLLMKFKNATFVDKKFYGKFNHRLTVTKLNNLRPWLDENLTAYKLHLYEGQKLLYLLNSEDVLFFKLAWMDDTSNNFNEIIAV